MAGPVEVLISVHVRVACRAILQSFPSHFERDAAQSVVRNTDRGTIIRRDSVVRAQIATVQYRAGVFVRGAIAYDSGRAVSRSSTARFWATC